MKTNLLNTMLMWFLLPVIAWILPRFVFMPFRGDTVFMSLNTASFISIFLVYVIGLTHELKGASIVYILASGFPVLLFENWLQDFHLPFLWSPKSDFYALISFTQILFGGLSFGSVILIFIVLGQFSRSALKGIQRFTLNKIRVSSK